MKTLIVRVVLVSSLVLAYSGGALAVTPNLSAKNAPPTTIVSDPRDAVKARASSQTQGIPADAAKGKPNSTQTATPPGGGEKERR